MRKKLRKGIVFGILFVLLAAMVVLTVPTNVSAAPNKWVKKTYTAATPGWGTTRFASIQTAVNAATSGDHIFVFDDTYYEAVTISTNNIILEGESRVDTKIDGGGNSHVVQITADDISMDKFTVQTSGDDKSGIFLRGVPGSPANYVNGCTISNINCEDNDNGIKLYYAGEDSDNYNTFQYIYCNIYERYQKDNSIWLEKEANWNEFSDCYIFQSEDDGDDGAIQIRESIRNTFTSIEISGNDGDGFHLEYDSDWNEIDSSEIWNTENGIALIGTTSFECNDNTIRGCDIDSNENSCIYMNTCYTTTIENNNLGASGDSADYVIQLFSASDTTIRYNVIKAGDVGIGLDSDSDSNEIDNNDISVCWSYGVEILSSFSNEIHHNNFNENNGAGEEYDPEHIQAYDDVGLPFDLNSWDNGYPDPAERSFDIDIDGGNYWSDWEGLDEYSGPGQNAPGPDGIVDALYDIEGTSCDDFYPLKEPVEI